MVCSMTGYGYGYGEKDGVGIAIEMKSVNHRYLDLSFRLPKELQRWEEKIRGRVKDNIERGRVEIRLKLESVPEDMHTVQVNRSLVQAYHRALQDVNGIIGESNSVTCEHLLNFPEIFIVEDRLEDDEILSEAIEGGLMEALNGLLAQRKKEGENLRRDLLERCVTIEQNVEKADAKAPMVVENYRNRLQQKLKELEGGLDTEERVQTECAMFAERCDITEEIVRMRSHLQLFRETVQLEGAIGRKLDFILQEMFREINTLGSKGNNKEISGLVVEMKTDLEKMREQVQNIE